MPGAPPICGHKIDEGYCQAPPGYGTNHPGIGACSRHGGNRNGAGLDARKILIRDAAITACEKLKLNFQVITPEQALQEELVLSYALVQWYTENTDTESAMWPVWQEMWMNERRHLMQVTKLMLDAGIAERTVRVMEAQAMAMATAIRTILDRLELNEDQARRAPMIVRDVLAGMNSGPLQLETRSR